MTGFPRGAEGVHSAHSDRDTHSDRDAHSAHDEHSVHDEQRVLRARVALTRQIDQGGVVLSTRLANAFLHVPRHPFVPVFYRRTAERFIPWEAEDGDSDEWLAAVYTDDSLITEVDGVHAEKAPAEGLTGVPTSSSTAPGLMADMLDALDVEHGQEVLEIGTGSGYNAALLCRLAGDAHLTTVDHSAWLTGRARSRLAATGFRPRVLTGDGARDLPRGARYDRIIATASVRSLPPAWLERCRTGGLMVVPFKGVLAGGVLARLTKLPDGTAAGQLLHTPAAFMPLRSGPEPAVPEPGGATLRAVRRRSSALSGRALDDWTFSFFAELHFDPELIRTYGQRDGRHVTTLISAVDGSRTTVVDAVGAADAAHGGQGTAVVSVSGPRDLWAPVEAAHERWRSLHRPRREWFRIEVGPDGQAMTYTAPDGREHRWALPATAV